MLILRLNCDAALANLSTRTWLGSTVWYKSAVVCEEQSSDDYQVNLGSSFQSCHIEQVGFFPSLDVYSFRGHVLGVLIEGDNGVLKRLAVHE